MLVHVVVQSKAPALAKGSVNVQASDFVRRFDRRDRHGLRQPAPPTSQPWPVRAVTVERLAEGETVSLTGHIRAKEQVNLAFRLDGRDDRAAC